MRPRVLPATMSDTVLLLKNRYEIEREIGRGGMSVVYLARDRQLLSKRVVIKVLLENIGEDAWVRKKFLQEIRRLAPLIHAALPELPSYVL